ncbi:MAG: hypothetical protein J6P21_02245, partial [Clostridia bacterium]|nr:hypothetical protein [Clostridia bacterium]
SVYDIIPSNKHLIGKSNTYTVERMNRLLRHYLARFARKTYCWSRSLSLSLSLSLSMISFSVSLFAFFISLSIYFGHAAKKREMSKSYC